MSLTLPYKIGLPFLALGLGTKSWSIYSYENNYQSMTSNVILFVERFPIWQRLQCCIQWVLLKLSNSVHIRTCSIPCGCHSLLIVYVVHIHDSKEKPSRMYWKINSCGVKLRNQQLAHPHTLRNALSSSSTSLPCIYNENSQVSILKGFLRPIFSFSLIVEASFIRNAISIENHNQNSSNPPKNE